MCHINPPVSSHFGDVFEDKIKSAKIAANAMIRLLIRNCALYLHVMKHWSSQEH